MRKKRIETEQDLEDRIREIETQSGLLGFSAFMRELPEGAYVLVGLVIIGFFTVATVVAAGVFWVPVR